VAGIEDLEFGHHAVAPPSREDPRMIGKLFSNTSSPKLTVPQVRVAISGRSRSGAARSCGVIPTAPPVVNCTMMSLRARISA
jgi:hypothetical protein